MIGFVISILAFLAVLTPLVTLHELGHFLAARAFRVKIERFSVGFGRALLSRVDKHGTEWRLAWLPLGGYVKFAGDLDAASVPDQAGLAELRQRVIATDGPGAERDYFHFKPLWQRALITVAGPVANFVVAIVLLTVLFTIVPDQAIAPRVALVQPGSPAAAAGFVRGDLITAVNGRAVTQDREVTNIVVLSGGESLMFSVDRAGAPVTLRATPLRVTEEDQVAGRVRVARIGLALAPLSRADVQFRRLNPLQAANKGVGLMRDVLGGTIKYLGRMATGKESGDQFSGPLGIAKIAGGVTAQASAGITDPGQQAISIILNLVYMAAIVSVGMGFLNLLPIPVLDGGHLLFYAYEAVARRPAPARVQEYGYRVGLALLAGFMLFATWNDLHKLSLFNFLGGLA